MVSILLISGTLFQQWMVTMVTNIRCFILALLLLLPWRGWGAAGDILWATVEDNGWVLKLQVEGVATNGTFDFGFLTNNTGPSKVVVNVTSMGFDDAGAATTMQRTIYEQNSYGWRIRSIRLTMLLRMSQPER